MGKIRVKVLGLEDVEKEQKEKAKRRREEKKKRKKVLEEHKPEIDKDKNKNEDQTSKANDVEVKTVKEHKEKRSVKHVQGKKYLKAKSMSAKKPMLLEEAVKLLRKMHYVQFDETFELHLNVVKTGLKGEIEIPFGTGKKIKAVIADENLLKKIEGGSIDFDVLIAHPSFMPRLAKYARILGPKGLMPSPKKGTISNNPEEAIKKFTDKLVQWKTEQKFPLIHQAIGKLSFKDKEVVENAKALISAVGLKNIKSAFIKLTMTPSVEVDLKSLQV